MMDFVITDIKDLDLSKVSAGDSITYSGIVVTMRDRAHKRALDLLAKGEKVPFSISAVFHASPVIADGQIVSIGPTTSARMEAETDGLLANGSLRIVMGKGGMSPGLFSGRGIYCAMAGGAGSFYASFFRVVSKHWEDLGAETVYVMEAKELPLSVAIDSRGKSLYKVAEL